MSLPTYAEIKKVVDGMQIPTKAFIGGKFVSALSGKTIPSMSPITGEKLADFAACGKEDVDAAVKCAQKVFNSGV